MRWDRRIALSGCAVCGGLGAEGVLRVSAARDLLSNRRNAVSTQFSILQQGGGSEATVRSALEALNTALTQARETLQTGHGTATIDEWEGLQDMYRRAEYTFNETTRLLGEGVTAPSSGGGGKSSGAAGGKTPPAGGGEGGFDLSSITGSPAFLPVVLGVGAVGVVLLLTGNKGK
jgi:hypothetical protein